MLTSVSIKTDVNKVSLTFVFQENKHTRSNVEERAQNLKGRHHSTTVWVELGSGHVQVLKKSILEGGQGEDETQDLK